MSNLSIHAQEHNTWQLCSWFQGILLPLPCVTSIFHAIAESKKDQNLRYSTHLFNSFHFCTTRKQRKENVINRTIVCWLAVLLKQKSEFQKSVSPDVKTYYKNHSEEPAWCQLKTECIDQWKRKENPEIDPHRNSQLIFDKRRKTNHWRQHCLFSQCCSNNWMCIYHRKIQMQTLQPSQN